jgi:hypothetical protein
MKIWHVYITIPVGRMKIEISKPRAASCKNRVIVTKTHSSGRTRKT